MTQTQFTYTEIKNIAEQWTEEVGLSVYDIWYHPYKAEGQSEMTVLQVLWSLHTERQMSVEGMRLHFERFVDAVKTRQEAEKKPAAAKTQQTTTKQDTRTIAQVAKSVAAMRRRVGAAVRKHNKLQARIQKLEAAGRIVSLNKDTDILAGIHGWYVKSDSLNPDPDALTNWYYETTYNAEAGYGCSCEATGTSCKHIHRLSATFAPVAQPAVTQPRQQEDWSSPDAPIYSDVKPLATVANRGTLNGRQGFQLMR